MAMHDQMYVISYRAHAICAGGAQPDNHRSSELIGSGNSATIAPSASHRMGRLHSGVVGRMGCSSRGSGGVSLGDEAGHDLFGDLLAEAVGGAADVGVLDLDPAATTKASIPVRSII